MPCVERAVEQSISHAQILDIICDAHAHIVRRMKPKLWVGLLHLCLSFANFYASSGHTSNTQRKNVVVIIGKS